MSNSRPLLLIDGDNLPAPRLTALRRHLRASEIIVHHTLAPTRAGWQAEQGSALRIEVAPGRNATDMRLGIEAAKWIAVHGVPARVVLATQDADLLELARWLQAQAVDVTIVGDAALTADVLRAVASFQPLPPTRSAESDAQLAVAVREALARCQPNAGGFVSLAELAKHLCARLRRSPRTLRRWLRQRVPQVEWHAPAGPTSGQWLLRWNDLRA